MSFALRYVIITDYIKQYIIYLQYFIQQYNKLYDKIVFYNLCQYNCVLNYEIIKIKIIMYILCMKFKYSSKDFQWFVNWFSIVVYPYGISILLYDHNEAYYRFPNMLSTFVQQ